MVTKRILQILKLNQFSDIRILYFKKSQHIIQISLMKLMQLFSQMIKNYRGDYHNYRQKHEEILNIECHLYF